MAIHFTKQNNAIEDIEKKAKLQVACAAYAATLYESLPSSSIEITTKARAVRGCKQKVKLLGIAMPLKYAFGMPDATKSDGDADPSKRQSFLTCPLIASQYGCAFVGLQHGLAAR